MLVDEIMAGASDMSQGGRMGRLDAVGMPWLVSVRWAGVLAQVGAIVAGSQGLSAATRLTLPIAIVGVTSLSNAWLSWRLSRRLPLPTSVGGWLVCADVVLLSWLLHYVGGVLNPVSIYYLVYIVLAALVLDRPWAWGVTSLSIAGYGLLFLAPPEELAAAGQMHPEVTAHIRGMWLAFAGAALLVAILVSRLAALLERRERALANLRDRSARDARLASLTTLAAGAAHELSTPLATIAVASRELELALERDGINGESLADAHLIRAEVDRCRLVLHDMSARLSQPLGEVATTQAIDDVIDRALDQLTPAQRAQVRRKTTAAAPVTWPAGVVTRALVNVLRNALQASPPEHPVELTATAERSDRIALIVTDAGPGMSAEVLARAGEPFYTTKPQGHGTGLGLFVARSSVEQLGGTLTLGSRPGAGTTVTLTLPVDVSTPRP